MADVEEFDDQEQPAPPISDTNLDDAGELDYEPSEPSANSIKDAVSDDEEEGEAGDSDHEQKSRATGERSQHDFNPRQSPDDEGIASGPENKSGNGGDAGDEFSGPEEGEVDELEEGEVKESDDESDGGKVNRHPKSKSDEGESGDQRAKVDFRQQSQEARGDDSQRQQPRRIPITAPSPTSATDSKTKAGSQGGSDDGGICKFFLRGQCTWGSFCKFSHSSTDRPRSPTDAEKPRRLPDQPAVIPTAAPIPLMALKADLPPPPPISMSVSVRGASPPPESAWERGLKQARERIKRATEQKEIDPDFERKRLTMPLDSGAAIDETLSPIIVDQQSANYRPAPRPLMEFGRGGDRFGDERIPAPPSDDPAYGREPYYDRYGNGGRPGYERRQQTAQSIGGSRVSRESVDDVFSNSQQQPLPYRRADSQEYFGMDRRERPLGEPAPAGSRDRQQYNRGDFPPAPVDYHRSQEILSPHASSAPYYHRHSTSSSGEYGGPQQHQDRRIDERGGGDRDERRRLEPGADSQGWEFRRSPPAYYRDPERPEGDRGNVPRRNFDNDRPLNENDNRRPPMQQVQPRLGNRGGPTDGRNAQQQNRPPNYHYYRTLHQQQQYQNRDRNRPSDQERKPPSDLNKDRERDKNLPKGRNEYNYHYYSTKDRQNQSTGGGGRPLPYERPSYTRQEHRGQWRDPWRRSTSPGGRRGTGSAGGGAEHRHSSQSKRTPSRGEDRSATTSPVPMGDTGKRRRRTSGSSSASGSSASSRSRSSGGSIKSSDGQGKDGRRPLSGLPGSGGRKEAPIRNKSVASSRSGGASPRRREQQQSVGSPMDNGRGSRYDRYKGTSRDRSPLRAGRKDSSDVASRAAAKALGHGRSTSPFEDESPRAYRRGGSGSMGDRRSSAGSRNSGQAHIERRYQGSTSPRRQSPDISAETRPLSPPPPAPVLATTALQFGGRGSDKVKAKHGSVAQPSEKPRTPIKMTITPKSKVRTNIYEQSPEAGGAVAGSLSDAVEDTTSEQIPLSPLGSPATPNSDGEPPQKMMKTGPDSGSGSGGESRVMSRREELLRQLRAVEHAIDAKRKKDKK